MQFCIRQVAFLVLLTVLFSSCRKKDTDPPTVQILQPSENSSFNVFDTITVRFSVHDETELTSVTIKLLNLDQIPVLNSIEADVPGNGFEASAQLVIDDKLLETADYYVTVIARDGTNEKRSFRKARVNALPKQRRGIYCSTAAGQIWKIDSLFQSSTLYLLPGHDILRMSVNSLSDRLTVAGNFSTRIANYDLKTGSMVWSDEVFQVAQTPRYRDLVGHGNDVYAALFDREIRSYGLGGSLTFNQQTGDYRPELIYVDDNFLVIEMELVGANDHFIFVYQASTKALLWQMDIPMDVKAICPFDSDEVMLFGNEGGDAKVLLYNMADNGYWEPRQLPVGEILTACELETKHYAISHADGLYAYTYSPNYLNLIRNGTIYQDVNYDVDNGVIIGATQNVMEEMTMNGNVLNTISLSDSISSFDIHYTR